MKNKIDSSEMHYFCTGSNRNQTEVNEQFIMVDLMVFVQGAFGLRML